MNKIIALIIAALLLSACSAPAPAPLETRAPTADNPQAASSTPPPTLPPSATPSPSQPPPTETLTPTATPAPPERPAFLAWPLPDSIGAARISQYPNSPWTWNYLGLNPGHACPPMFGYLEDPGSWLYWRDLSLPDAQDRAQADPHQFEMVECYAGDAAQGEGGHAGTDFKAPPDTPVYAAADGRVMNWRDSGNNSMLVLEHCIGGTWDANQQCAGGRQWYTTYMHIALDPAVMQANLEIAQGARIGAVYDQMINSHLHLEVGHGQRSYTTYVNPWGADSAPWLDCLWLDPSRCPIPDPAGRRLAYLAGDGRLFTQQGTAEPVEVPAPQGVQQASLWQAGLVALDPQGNLFVQESLDGTRGWDLAAEQVVEYQAAGPRLAILDRRHNLRVKEVAPGQGLAGEWRLLAEDVQAFSLSAHRLGYLNGKDELRVQEGSLDNEWLGIAKQVVAFQVSDSRIAFVNKNRALFVNEGKPQSEYERLASDVRAFQATDVRLGAIDKNGRLWTKDGNLRAEWVLQAEHVQAFQLSGYRVLMQNTAGAFQIKEGSLYQDWSSLPFAEPKQVWLNGGTATLVSEKD